MSPFNKEAELLKKKRIAKEQVLKNEHKLKLEKFEMEKEKILASIPFRIKQQLEKEKEQIVETLNDSTLIEKALEELDLKREELIDTGKRRISEYMEQKKIQLKKEYNSNLNAIRSEWSEEYKNLKLKYHLELSQRSTKVTPEKERLENRINDEKSQSFYNRREVNNFKSSLYKEVNEEKESIICPKCRGNQIFKAQKGYSIVKGLTGAIITGGMVGLIAGMHGRKKIINVCEKCGKSWV